MARIEKFRPIRLLSPGTLRTFAAPLTGGGSDIPVFISIEPPRQSTRFIVLRFVYNEYFLCRSRPYAFPRRECARTAPVCSRFRCVVKNCSVIFPFVLNRVVAECFSPSLFSLSFHFTLLLSSSTFTSERLKLSSTTTTATLNLMTKRSFSF